MGRRASLPGAPPPGCVVGVGKNYTFSASCDICDNVTILDRGEVAFHGTLDRLRAMAPDPGHHLHTSDDARAAHLAVGHPRLSVAAQPDGSGLLVTGPRESLSAYVVMLVRAGLELLALTPTRTPLEQLFFMLTDAEEDVA